MTLSTTYPLGSPGVDRFSPSQLLRTARLFASDPDLPKLLDRESGERRWTVLESSPYLQIWLLSWPVGSETGWHDHGESRGGFLTVSGTLIEQVPHGHRRIERTLGADEGRTFGSDHIHNVTNAGLEPAFSIHLYTPRLTKMTRYAMTPAGLQIKAVEHAGTNW